MKPRISSTAYTPISAATIARALKSGDASAPRDPGPSVGQASAARRGA
jgi:hypothetical protein